jgi:selT/selW/selH-like putative selenoprotein
MLRAAWMGQELLSTFELEVGEVALVPGSGGVFEIYVEGERIWSRAVDGGFPDIKQLTSSLFATGSRRAKNWGIPTDRRICRERPLCRSSTPSVSRVLQPYHYSHWSIDPAD